MAEKKQKQSLNLDAEFLNLIDPVVCKVEVDWQTGYLIYPGENVGLLNLNMKVSTTCLFS